MTNHFVDNVFGIVISPSANHHHKLVACVVMSVGDLVNVDNVPINSVHLYFLHIDCIYIYIY